MRQVNTCSKTKVCGRILIYDLPNPDAYIQVKVAIIILAKQKINSAQAKGNETDGTYSCFPYNSFSVCVTTEKRDFSLLTEMLYYLMRFVNPSERI